MPRLSALRLAALANLAEQLRYAPRRAALRQLASAVALAGEIDPRRNYPEDWVVQRVTGYRPDIERPATLVGEALLGELSAFVERVSESARLTPHDLPRGSLGVEALARRWRVSRRSVERYRRKGLIAHRVRDERNQALLLFTPQAIEQFEASSEDDLRRAGDFSRLDADAERRAARLGLRAARRFGWSLTDSARRVALRLDRSPETVRRAMLRAADAPRRRSALSARDREVMLMADRRGLPVRRLAQRFGRSEASVRRLILEERARRLRAVTLPTGEWDAEAPDHPAARADLLVEPDSALETFLGARDDAPPDPARERALATAHRALLLRAGAGAHAPGRPASSMIDRAETDLRWATLLRARLIHEQRRTIVQAMEGALGAPLESLPPRTLREAHSAALDAAIAATAAFDPARGGRLAAPILLAVQRALARGARTERQSGARATARSVRLDDWRPRLAPWRRWLDPPPFALQRAQALPERARCAVVLRFGLEGDSPRTVEEIARELHLAPQAASRLLRDAVRSLYAQGAAGPTAQR